MRVQFPSPDARSPRASPGRVASLCRALALTAAGLAGTTAASAASPGLFPSPGIMPSSGITTVAGSPAFWALQPPRSFTAAELQAEIATLRATLVREVPRVIVYTPQRNAIWIALAQAEAARSENFRIDRPQLVVVVDRNPGVEELALVVARPTVASNVAAAAPGAAGGTDSGEWEVIGGVKVSTGQAGRFDHYITPTGVFLHTADILDYRAEGTLNENGIRGLGVKGMRVWDFGWQWASKGWRADGERGQIRLEMHATDPDYLAQRIGRTASQGCIRIPDAMNRFLDRHGVLDADYEHAAADDVRYRAVLLANRVPTPLAGNAMIVVDSLRRG